MSFKYEEGYHKFRYAKKLTKSDWTGILPDEYWIYREKWENNPRKFIIEDYPLHLAVEITTHCNLKCTFCTRTINIEKGVFRDVKHMPFDLFKEIVDESKQYKLYGFCLNGIGEPLMHPDLVEMIRYSKDVGKMVDVMFHTSAMLLNPELSEGIIKAGLDQMIFSVDGSGKKEYETNRIGAKYDRAVKNIKEFREIRSRLGKRLPLIRLTMIIDNKTNEESANEFVQQWDALADVITFQEVADYTQELGETNTYNLMKNPDFVCTQPWQRLAIDVNGNVVPCCEAFIYKNKMILGKVGKDKIYDVWHGEKMETIREKHQHNQYSKLPFCAKCSLSFSLK